jgi:hypothetical protein
MTQIAKKTEGFGALDVVVRKKEDATSSLICN